MQDFTSEDAVHLAQELASLNPWRDDIYFGTPNTDALGPYLNPENWNPQPIEASDASDDMWQMHGIDIDGTHSVGSFPIRQDITVLPADDPQRLRLGWAIYEEVGIAVVNDYGLTRIDLGDEVPMTDPFNEEPALPPRAGIIHKRLFRSGCRRRLILD